MNVNVSLIFSMVALRCSASTARRCCSLQSRLFDLTILRSVAQAADRSRVGVAAWGGSAAATRAAFAFECLLHHAVFSSTALAMSIRPSIAAMRAVSRAVQPGSTVDVFAPTANPGTLTPMPPLNPLQDLKPDRRSRHPACS